MVLFVNTTTWILLQSNRLEYYIKTNILTNCLFFRLGYNATAAMAVLMSAALDIAVIRISVAPIITNYGVSRVYTSIAYF